MSVYYQNIHEYLQEVNQSQNQTDPGANNQSMPPSPAVHFNRPPPPPPAEMHEFISEIAPNTIPQPRFNPYAPPPPRNGLFPLTDFLQDPLNAGLNTLTKVAAIARSPSQMINHAATGAYHLIHQNTNSIFRPPGQAERVFPGSGPSSIVQDPFNSMDGDEGVPLPPPVLPLINCTVAQNRLEPLTAAELVGKTWTKDELAVRVFKGGIAEDNKLRARLYPILLGLAKDLDNDAPVADYVFDWSKLENLYQHYENQWKAILPEQERRFALFRERKSLIERDVIRCDRTHPYYEGDTKSLDLLKNLLLTYMMYDFDTGYVQGMSDLASPLLYVAEGKVEHAFWFFSQVMDFTHNNFEMSQMTIKLQLDMLWKLIELTDPIFAQYLANNDSVNCYFAFRWIVCQFKRELMKTNCDGYDDILKLWESIWTCNSMRRHLMKLKEDQKAKEAKETEAEEKIDSEETIGTAQSTSTSNAPSDSVKYPSLKELAALEREQESAELVAAMAGSCKIEDSEQHSNAQVVLDPTKLETHSAPAAAAAMSSTSTSEGEEGEEGGGAAGEAKPTESGSGGCSSASSRPSVAVSAVNLNVYVPEVKRLTDSELYVLCICLCIIRRERDLIMANRFDATEILKHFNTLQFTLNLKDILLHAANIWSWLVYDEKEELLYAGAAGGGGGGDSSSASSELGTTQTGGTAGSVGSMSAQHGSSVADSSTSTTARNEADDFDLLPDARISTISGEDYFLMN